MTDKERIAELEESINIISRECKSAIKNEKSIIVDNWNLAEEIVALREALIEAQSVISDDV